MTEQELLALGPALAKFLRTFLFCCDYTQTFGHLGTYVHGLLSDLPRKSVEPIALQAGTPVRTLQEFVKDHAWDFERVRELLQDHTAASLAKVPDADDLGTVGLIDETGTPKKGDKTPGVQRQWCGRLGKVENCVVTVHLGVARGGYKTLIDFDLFLPESWSNDRKRCRAAGIPKTLVHRTKGCIALGQLDRAKERGVQLDWLTFDEEYGKSPGFIAGLEERQLCFVGEVPRTLSCLVVNRSGRRPTPEVTSRSAEQVVANTTAFREQQWQVVRLSRQTQPDQVWRVKAARVWLHSAGGWSARTYWLIWASNDETGEEKFFLSNASEDTPVETLVRVAFTRWNVEHTFRVAKTELGFGHFEGRNYVALMRHMSLCLVAMGFVAEQTDRLREKKIGSDTGTGMPSSACDMPGVVGSATRHQRQAVRPKYHRTPPKTQPRRTPIATQQRACRPNPQEAPAVQTSKT
jgi:SRSO17 transposase